jgi:Cytochrome P460
MKRKRIGTVVTVVVAVSISQNEKLVAVILANPVMINACQSGIPSNGKPFPDGSRMAKIHWNPKSSRRSPVR